VPRPWTGTNEPATPSDQVDFAYLHDHAAAVSILLPVVHVVAKALTLLICVSKGGLLSVIGRLLAEAANFPYKVVEGFIHIDPLLS